MRLARRTLLIALVACTIVSTIVGPRPVERVTDGALAWRGTPAADRLVASSDDLAVSNRMGANVVAASAFSRARTAANGVMPARFARIASAQRTAPSGQPPGTFVPPSRLSRVLRI